MPQRLHLLLAGLVMLWLIIFGVTFLPDDFVDPSSSSSPEIVTQMEQGHPPTTSSSSTKVANATVIRVVDGDTLVATLDAEPGEWKIRLLGINTPETVDPRRSVECFGKEASKKLKELVEKKRVRLEEDTQADERDKYDRLLRNVFLEDGTDINALLVREGYAYAYLSYPLNRHRKAELYALEQTARGAEAGLWSDNACPVHS